MFIRRHHIAALHDVIMAALSVVLSLYLRLDTALLHGQIPYLLPATLLFTAICAIVFSVMQLHRGMWRYASAKDLTTIVKAASVSVILFVPALFLLTRMEGYPRSALVINWLLLIIMLGAPRLLYRMIRDAGIKAILADFRDQRIPVVLIGAGDNTELFIRETTRTRANSFRPVAVLSDDTATIGRNIHGVPVFGPVSDIEATLDKLSRRKISPRKIIISRTNRDGELYRYLLAVAEKRGMTMARLPSFNDLQTQISERIATQPIVIEDLLGRAQHARDLSSVRSFVKNKVVLVTGAGGSIGSELVRQIAAADPDRLILMDNSEYALYHIDQEMHDKFRHVPRTALLGDVRDHAYITSLFKTYAPDIVFHAAAIKHVPLAEDNPLEAIMTNVTGTRNVADAAIAAGSEAMVMISTDKAVNPTNIMGATKRLAEHYCHAVGAESSHTKVITVRFGNVLGSNGSVVPLFQKQIAAGGPITITDPSMTRYFMTIREAVELVIGAAQAGCHMTDRNGFIFVLDMGDPVRISDMAKQMIRLAGLKEDEDIKIKYIGVRPGEKLYEELFYPEESPVPTPHDGIMLATAGGEKIKSLRKKLDALSKQCQSRHRDQVLTLFRELVPEYQDAR